ncbi:ProQ/FinO family protein [Cupriavidus sp. SW-Y-13]|uniref:ProQ/FinO family protein n=1 Tax=Cupriavidus sp. SW-Y-13 TaxID=2653854 RepID=UPI001365858F|nr:ProQ activator of osmoprotectant transporter prop [Cupriavidus sp. SW-Y-13]
MGFEQLADLKAHLAAKARLQDQQRKAPSLEARGQKGASHVHDANRGESPRAKRHPAAKRSPKDSVDPTVVLLGKLQKRFPLSFPKKPAPKAPLKVGILQDLLSQKSELSLSEDEIRAALSTWCRGIRYWEAVVEGAVRVALDGSVAGHVTESEASRARHLLARRQKPPVESAP